MTAEHFAVLQENCNVVLANHPNMVNQYIAAGLTEKRFRWDVLKAGTSIQWLCDELYPYLNDDHIDTALRAIVKGL
jgi:hypothetical protein